jgi:uncharacterized protein YcfJ
MSAKKMLCMLSAGALLAAAAPAFADQPRWARAHGYRHHPHHVVVKHHYRPVVREVVVRRTVIVERPVYFAQPAIAVHRPPAYYGGPAVYAAPVYDPALATLGGAIIGAAIGSQFGKGDGRTAAIAVGAVLGGVLGSGR